MKLLGAMLVAATLVLAGVGVFAMLNLRALIGAHRDQLVARVETLLGRPITVGDVVPSWWPLGVRLRTVTVGESPAFGPGSFLAAEGMVLTVRPWPLVSGRIEAAGLVLDRPRVTLVRDAEGRWNVGSLGATSPPDGGGSATSPVKERRRTMRLPLEWMVGIALSNVHEGTLVIDDHLGGAARQLVLRHVRLRAEDVFLGATARLRLEAAVFTADAPDLLLDLRVPQLGLHELEQTPVSARLELREIDLAAVGAWLGGLPAMRGRVARVVLDAEGTLTALRGGLELRADDPGLGIADLALGAAQPLLVKAHGTRSGERVTIEQAHAAIGELELDAQGEATLTPWRVALTLAPRSNGVLALGERSAPLRVGGVGGRVVLDREGLALQPLRLEVDGMPVEARGWITGVDPPALDLRLEGRPFGGTLAADVALEPSGAARAHVEVGAIDLAAAAARLAPALAGRVEGRASGAAVLTMPAGAGRVTPESLTGNGTLTVAHGRLRNVNLPDLVVAQIESIPFMPQLVSARTRSRYAELFAGRDTVVESASVPFTLAHGKISTENAALANPAYQISGQGWIASAEQLRFRGIVLLGASVSRTLRDDVPAAKHLMTEDGRVALPFVARGRLGRVWVEPDAKRLRALGLTALLGAPPADAEPAPEGDQRGERRRDEPLEDKLIERLERFLHP